MKPDIIALPPVETRGGLCPKCGATLDAASGISGARHPKPGDMSICLYCAVVLVYEDAMTSRLMTAEEFMALPIDWQDMLLNITDKLRAARLRPPPETPN